MRKVITCKIFAQLGVKIGLRGVAGLDDLEWQRGNMNNKLSKS